MARERMVRRPWGRKKGREGWIIQPEELLKALKEGDIAEFGNLRLGAKQLSNIIKLMDFPDHELLISFNGHLEVRNIQRIIRERKGVRRTYFKKPRNEHSFRLMDGAWLPSSRNGRPKLTVVIRPRKYA